MGSVSLVSDQCRIRTVWPGLLLHWRGWVQLSRLRHLQTPGELRGRWGRLHHLRRHGGGVLRDVHSPPLGTSGVKHGNDLFPGDDMDRRVVLGLGLLLGDASQDGHRDLVVGHLRNLVHLREVGHLGLCLSGVGVVLGWGWWVDHLLGVARHHVGRGWGRATVGREHRTVGAHGHRHGDQVHRLLVERNWHHDWCRDAVVHWHVPEIRKYIVII